MHSARGPSLFPGPRILATGALLTATILLVCCQDEGPPCERCEFTFYWDSNGNLSASDEECHELDCEDTMCGVCYDITYSEFNQPVGGTCDNCTETPRCENGNLSYCPMHFDECDAEDWPDELTCGCVDLRENDGHCGECYNACLPGSYCRSGSCFRPGG